MRGRVRCLRPASHPVGSLGRRPAPTTGERHGDAASAPLRYRRREPEKTLLHAIFREHLESFLAQARERSSHGRALSTFELRAYTGCGVLARGFARVRCPDCGFEQLVAFSCKASICPSCATRRMEDGADHLVRNVLPAVPVRQWVLSFPRQEGLELLPNGSGYRPAEEGFERAAGVEERVTWSSTERDVAGAYPPARERSSRLEVRSREFHETGSEARRKAAASRARTWGARMTT